MTLAFYRRASARVALPAMFYAVIFVAIGLWTRSAQSLAQDITAAPRDSTPIAQFVGSAACGQCHTTQLSEWRGSHHAGAMQVATDATVLGRFDNATFAEDGVETTFFKKDGKFWIRTLGPDGSLTEFEVKYTFGLSPVQQYLIELSGGRLQAFGIAWDTRPVREGGQRWYHLYPGRKLRPGDPLHWTGIDQNWNYQCAWCHSTNLRKNYNRATQTFNTEWSEINVGCEACHGPASNHIAWASKEKGAEIVPQQSMGFDLSFDERRTSRWTMAPAGTAIRSQRHATAKEIQVCAGCHARRAQVSDAPSDVRRYFDAFRTAQFDQDLYHVDGQQRDEVFEFGSFLQSRMHAAGVICSDCHNPHSGKLRTSGNAVCSQCHAPAQFDTPAHHHHTAASRGAECTSCHMPTTVYMGVHARHDHSIRIPRPDRTHALGTPNACNQCHVDKSSQWAANAIKSWHPSPKPGAQTFAEAFDLGDRGAIGAQNALIGVVQDDSLSGIVRASAITRLGRFPSLRVLSVIAGSLKVNDPDIRMAAIAALSNTDAATRRTLLVPLLKDVTRVVRMNAAHQLAGDAEQGLSPEDLQLLERGLAEYVAAQLFNAERPESHANLGALYLRRGMIDRARSAFLEALQLDPMFAPAAISLADLERAGGNEQAVQQILISAIQRNPKSGALLHALGLSLVRLKRHAEAIEKFREAATLAPEVARFSYVLAVASHGAGRIGEAVEILKAALVRNPHDRDLLTGLISYEVEAGDVQSAVSRAELLGKLEPDRADIQRFIARLKRDAR